MMHDERERKRLERDLVQLSKAKEKEDLQCTVYRISIVASVASAIEKHQQQLCYELIVILAII